MGMKAEDVLGFTIGYVEETLRGAGGLKGEQGEKGDPGTTYTPVIGTVRTVDSLTEASASVVTNDVTKKATFNFDIPTGPQGAEGLQGQQGLQGEKGDTYTPHVGNVLTVDSTLDASVTISLDETNKKATFNFNIPKGADGAKGDKGETGEKGDRGDQGPQGIQGEKGEQGPAGVQGIQGIQGVQGEKGEDGYPFLIYKQYEVGIEEFNEADYPEIGLMFMVHVWEQDKGYPVYRYTGDGTDTPYTLITYMNTEGIKGDKGDKGDQGEQGVPGVAGADGVDGITYTPEIGSVNTVESSAGANVTLQVDHDQGRAIYNFDIPRGEDGTNGVDGQDGADGFSPIVTVTDIEGGHNVAIEDANGVKNFEVLNGKDTEQKIYTTIGDLGLTAPVTVGDIFNAMPNKTMTILSCEDIADHITDVPMSHGVLTIKKGGDGRFSIDYQNSLFGSPCDVKRWIGTLKGSDGTGLYWKQLSAEPTFVALRDIGLTADSSFQDVVGALPKGGSALLGVKEFTNYQTIFPYEDGNDQFARVHIVKGVADGSSMYARWFRKDGVKEAIAIFNINDNKFVGWKEIATKTVADVGFTTINQTNGLTAPTGITMTDVSKVNYCIRNGVCYVNIALHISSISDKINNWTTIAELPKSVIEAVGAMNCEGNTVPECMPIRISQAGKLTLMYKGTTTSTSDWWGYSFSYPVAE